MPNKNDLVQRLSEAVIFSKFDMKYGFWQVQISETNKYKIAFTTPFRHYLWNVMPFCLKNAYIYIYIYITPCVTSQELHIFWTIDY